MPTGQDFIAWVQANEPQSYTILRPDKCDCLPIRHATSCIHENEYSLWLHDGDTPQLRNMIRFSAGLPAVGTGKEFCIYSNYLTAHLLSKIFHKNFGFPYYLSF
ncbi:MAG: hypothetical protein KGI08_05045 [Thaumarchaeota archaeon]|nr:hypothetical protein [Nitrososphaerota archaeon]